jgi:hypothetical protein
MLSVQNGFGTHAAQQLTMSCQPNVNLLCLVSGLGAHKVGEGGLAILRSASVNTP